MRIYSLCHAHFQKAAPEKLWGGSPHSLYRSGWIYRSWLLDIGRAYTPETNPSMAYRDRIELPP